MSYVSGGPTGFQWRTLRSSEASEGGEGRSVNDSQETVTWTDDFDPAPDRGTSDRDASALRDRFSEYGKSVFGRFEEVAGDGASKDCVLLWLYVGPPEEQCREDGTSSWGQSIFAMVKPTDSAHSSETHWLDDAQISRHFYRAVERLSLTLSVAGYAQYAASNTIWELAQLNAAEVVSHEFKNLLQPLYLHAEDLSRQSAIIEDDGIQEQLTRLVCEVQWLSAFATGFYSLTDRRQRTNFEFTSADAISAAKAALDFTLVLLARSRENWIVEGPTQEESVAVLCRIYGELDERSLTKNIYVTLLILLMSEPARNVRASYPCPNKPDVMLSTVADDGIISLFQTTFESQPPNDFVISQSAINMNSLLPEGFACIREKIEVGSVEKIGPGILKVVRETQIVVNARPTGSTND